MKSSICSYYFCTWFKLLFKLYNIGHLFTNRNISVISTSNGIEVDWEPIFHYEGCAENTTAVTYTVRLTEVNVTNEKVHTLSSNIGETVFYDLKPDQKHTVAIQAIAVDTTRNFSCVIGSYQTITFLSPSGEKQQSGMLYYFSLFYRLSCLS